MNDQQQWDFQGLITKRDRDWVGFRYFSRRKPFLFLPWVIRFPLNVSFIQSWKIAPVGIWPLVIMATFPPAWRGNCPYKVAITKRLTVNRGLRFLNLGMMGCGPSCGFSLQIGDSTWTSMEGITSFIPSTCTGHSWHGYPLPLGRREHHQLEQPFSDGLTGIQHATICLAYELLNTAILIICYLLIQYHTVSCQLR